MHQGLTCRKTLHLPAHALQAGFDRVPVPFEHDLHGLPLFARSSLERLAERYAGRRGDYHVYEPDALSEAEVEPFFRKAEVDIGQVDLASRDPAKEHVFHLAPGLGFHQPHSAPQWVQTVASRSVSYTFVFETRASRLRSRARGFNHYLRQAGMTPSAPGRRPGLDAAKGRTMIVVTKAQRAVAVARRKLVG